MLQGVKILVEDIGADVNLGGRDGEVGGARSGRGDHTPICLAVLSGKKSMVELLLNLGATNVHPALKISRDHDLDDITGLLLKNVGLDRNGESVNLSGLDLVSVKPQWILPCLGVSDTLRRVLSRRPSFDRIKDLLLRRKSIGCIEDENLDLLRNRMEEGWKREEEGWRREDGGWRRKEGGGVGSDEPDSAIIPEPSPAPFHRPGHRRTLSGSLTRSLCLPDPSPLNSPLFPRRATPRQNERSKSEPPDDLRPLETTPTMSLPTTPTKTHPGSTSTPVKVRGSAGFAFQPTLPPICGTPVGSLQRFSIPSLSSRSGDIADSPTSPLMPRPPSGEGVGQWESRGTLVMSVECDGGEVPQPRTPQRRHHEKLNSLMIRRTSTGQNQLFPPSRCVTTSHSPTADSTDGLEEGNVTVAVPKKVPNVSPSVLLRRVSMLWSKKRVKERSRNLSSTASTISSRPNSPPARIFTDLTTHSMSGDSRDSTPVPTETRRPRVLGRVSTDEGIGTGTTPIPTGDTHSFAGTKSTPNSIVGFPLSPGSDCTDGGGGEPSPFSPTSTAGSTGLRSLSHGRRKSSSSLSSSSLCVNVWPDDSRSATEGPTSSVGSGGLVFRKDMKFQNHSSEVREKVTSARLVKVMDLSSNSLGGLEVMVGEGGGREERERGEIVLQRLRGLHRLDLKQNRLSRLPLSLMRELRKLSVLNLSCNLFEDLHSECVFSPALTSLDLSTNKVHTSYIHTCIHKLCVHRFA